MRTTILSAIAAIGFCAIGAAAIGNPAAASPVAASRHVAAIVSQGYAAGLQTLLSEEQGRSALPHSLLVGEADDEGAASRVMLAMIEPPDPC